MKSKKHGKSTSKAEVLSISQFGIWILVYEKEYFLSAREFPWFHSAKVEDVLDISLENDNHIRWKSLDIDLDLRSLDKLEQYPLIYVG
jgi:hypothetical protein